MNSRRVQFSGMLALFVLIFIWGTGMAQVIEKIERSLVVEMFERMRANGDWNIDDRCLWGYFFVDEDQVALERAAEALVGQGYRFVTIYRPDVDEGDPPYSILHVEKEEVHSVDSLMARNDVLYAFAERHSLASYDGMDVGPLTDGQCGSE